MKTLTKNLAKRSLSVLLVLMMVFSLLTVGITSVSAAEVEIAETGATFNVLLLGTFTNWTTTPDNTNTMTTTDYSNYTKTLSLTGGTTYKFKIYQTGGNADGWYGKDNAILTETNTVYFGNAGEGGDISFTPSASANYTFIYNTFYNSIVVSNTGSGDSGSSSEQTVFFFEASGWTTVNMYAWDVNENALNGAWPGSALTTIVTDTSGNRWYQVTVPVGAVGIIFNDGTNQTKNITDFSEGIGYTLTLTSGKECTYSTSTPDIDTGTIEDLIFWIDLNPDVDDPNGLDLLYPDKKGSNYTFYLPAYADTTKINLHVSEGSTLNVSGSAVSSSAQGTTWNLTDGINNGYYPITGSFTGNMYLRKSANIPAIHTFTDEVVPQGQYASGIDDETGATVNYDHKDKYETKGSIVVFDEAGNQLNANTDLKKIKGRGNSSWKASYQVIGKYAFNITLSKSAQLLDESFAAKKYCLVSYNADEARMRNMLIYELSQQIGIEYTPDYETVDFYNNGYYIGTYLLTDKVEIGDDETPLVNITNLDDINENFSADNAAIYEDDAQTKATSGTAGQPGYYMYASNIADPGQSVYEDSGFLLELELDAEDRFYAEFSGFISSEGQEVVCKYPEYATQAQMQFIMGKWNQAEELIYDGVLENGNYRDATYAELNNVIDVESFAKMYLIQELSKNLDAGSTSYYVYYDGGKLHAGVAWDFDWALGQYRHNGEEPKYVNNQTMGDFKNADNNNTEVGENNHDNPKGWWANSREIYPSENKLNFQAQLCHNKNFWKVVKAEWNEVFYTEAKKLVGNSTISSASSATGLVGTYYNEVHASTLMDENKWNIIANDPIYDWGSTNTGSNHDAAVVFLHNFIYNRLAWMNTGATTYHLDSDNYPLATPTLTTDKAAYAINETITLTAKTNSSGNLTYTLYDAAENELDSITTNLGYAEFTQTADKSNTTYSVKVSSANTTKVTDAAEATVEITGIPFTPTITASSNSVLAGKDVTLTVGNEQGYDGVDYSIYYSVNGGEAKLLNDTTYTQSTEGTVTFYVTATVTVDGETVTQNSETIDVVFTAYSITVSTSTKAPALDQEITVTATPSVTDIPATYELFVNGVSKETNETGIFKVTVDSYGTITYQIVATPTDATIAPASAQASVTVTEDTGEYNIKILFKAPTTWAYQPSLTIDGVPMTMTRETAIIASNSTNTARYYWYSYTMEEVAGNAELSLVINAQRSHFYKGVCTLNVGADDYVTEGNTRCYYLALENLNVVGTIEQPLVNISLTHDTAEERNWTMSAMNMIYDEGKDVMPNVPDNAFIAPTSFNFVYATIGDANTDGKINIKDATYIQKNLAGLVDASEISEMASDFNFDDKVSIKDATAIQKQLAGF